MNSKKTSIRAITLVAVLALGLSACSNAESESAAPNPTSSVAGPPVWNEAQTEYLNAINGAELASSVFLSASNYIEIGNTV